MSRVACCHRRSRMRSSAVSKSLRDRVVRRPGVHCRGVLAGGSSLAYYHPMREHVAWPVVSSEDCARALLLAGFRVTQRSDAHVVLEREIRHTSQVVLVPQVPVLNIALLTAILKRAHMAPHYFIDLVRAPLVKICPCGAQYRAEGWEALSCAGTMSDGDGEAMELRNCSNCQSSMAMPLKGARKREPGDSARVRGQRGGKARQERQHDATVRTPRESVVAPRQS